MNALFVSVGKNSFFNEEFVKKLVSRLNIDNSYAVCYEPVDDLNLFKTYFDFNRMLAGEYSSGVIDQQYLDPIPEYCIEIIHMMGRHCICDYDVRSMTYYKQVCFWDRFLIDSSIDIVYFGTCPHETFDYIVYLICKKRGIKTLYAYPDDFTIIQGYYPWYMCDSIESPGLWLKKRYQALLKEYEEGTINDDLCSDLYSCLYESLRKKFESDRIRDIPLLNHYRRDEISRYYDGPLKTWKSRESLSQKLKGFAGGILRCIMGGIKTYSLALHYESMTVKFDKSKVYLFYAMHYEPECTSSPQGGRFANQLLAIRLLSQCIPKGMVIYVKEHPAQLALFRNKMYYEEILKIPNVKLMSQRISSLTLIRHAKVVATLTGTVMYESQIAGKPCLCLGYSPRVCIPGIYETRTADEIRAAIDRIMNGTGIPCSEIKLKLFWRAVELSSFFEEDTNKKVDFFAKAHTLLFDL